METIVEKECSALGGLFQMIISDLKVGSPNWEDFLGKAAKLHSTLKATVFALTAFLDAFQKIADLATNARGATKDIGTALTRLCLRHRGVEAKLKTFSSAIMDHLCIPLQERLEDWKKIAFQMDKDHAKEYKRVRQDIKKKSSDTLRLQKKVRKAGKGDMKKSLDCAIQDVNDKYHLLEETEKHAVRRALIEERSRYCLFVSCLRPVVESELATLYEVSHLQEVLDSLTKLTEDPHSLPLASEQVIIDIKSSDSAWSFQTPPSSPTSLGSRKSSMCSISSLNSSSSDSTKSHSPSHHRSRSLSQPPVGALRLTSVSSQDSGFTSQDTLFTRLPTPPPMELTNQVTEFIGGNSGENSGMPTSPFPPAPCVTSTWPNLQDTMQFERAASSILKSQRPHTISSAYEKMGHNRPALTAHTFQPLQQALCPASDSANTLISGCDSSLSQEELSLSTSDGNEDSTPTHIAHIPPVPDRCPKGNESRPKIPEKPQILKQCLPKRSLQAAAAAAGSDIDPIYINLKELGNTTPKGLPDPQNSGDQNKVAFHKDLAAALAQNVALHQRSLKRTPCLNRQLSEPASTLSVDNSIDVLVQADFGGNQTTQSYDDTMILQASQIPKPPPPPVRRSSTLSIPPPIVPPHKTNTSFSMLTAGLSSKRTPVGDDKLGNHETSWNVFGEVGDSTNAHAQLIQALNARLNVLQQQTDIPETPKNSSFKNPPPPPPPKEMSKHFTVAVSTSKDLAIETFERMSRTDSLPRSQQPSSQTLKKPSRAHSIGGGDRESFTMNINSKFSQNQSQLSGPQQLKRQEVTAIVNKYATSPRNPLPTAQRRASQPVFPDTLQLGKTAVYPILSSMEGAPNPPVGQRAPIQPHQMPARVDRRCSLNLEQEFARQSSFGFGSSSMFPFPARGRDGHAQREMLESLEVGFPPMTDAAARVHNWLAGRGSSDLSQCRESLLGQIREGVNLRKAPSNDRSAPSL